ncbi:hypothetical protein TNIN_175151 [Trichonephila inaurata madagascariensis]|uniref:Uncharacterized protein n=1 Tax=Trichonephila inaurata madagascariensis TaxID=2747483 RepID=A0A8X6XI37_9ARAC|nr:hypothetical protein TNIN_175151 [Trichonephila inaurata madagascariensis]
MPNLLPSRDGTQNLFSVILSNTIIGILSSSLECRLKECPRRLKPVSELTFPQDDWKKVPNGLPPCNDRLKVCPRDFPP